VCAVLRELAHPTALDKEAIMTGRSWRTIAPTMAAAVLLLSLIPTSLPAQQPSDDIDALRRQASQLSRAGKYAEAIPISRRALVLAEQQLAPDNPKVAEALNDLAYLYFAEHRMSEAEPLYRRLLSTYETVPGHDDGEVWSTLRHLKAIHDAQDRLTDVETLAARMRAIEDKISAPFAVAIEPQEIISTDRKRFRLTDCGPISFEVSDPQTFLIHYGSVERARRFNTLLIASLFRRTLGSKSSTQVREQAEAIAQEIKGLIDADVNSGGVSVRDMNVDLTACAAAIPGP
jgi:tetratricopeptide (TPR) repeat protein